MYISYLILAIIFILSNPLLSKPPTDGNYSIFIHDDNYDTTLPKSYRSWYFKEFRGIPKDVPIKINIYGDGWEGGEYVIPVYSYYGTKWHRFEKDDVFSLPSDDQKSYNYTIYKKFKLPFVTLARFYPYDTLRLNKLEKRLSFKPFFRSQIIGKTGMGRYLKLFTITDFSVPNNKKKAIWIHARTHPSETGSSYVLEGMMEYILKNKTFEELPINLKELVFYIVPMVNLDGVIEENARVTPYTSIDLERQWIFDTAQNSRTLQDSAAIEAKVMNNTINRLIDEGSKFVLAINLHSTNGTENTYPFIFTNFSRKLPEHGAAGDSMFLYHLRYAGLINKFLCGGRLNVITSYSPSKPMYEKTYPESWWWVNFKEKVVAFTLESAYTHPGCYEERVNYKDHLQLGESIAKAIEKYYEIYYQNKLDIDYHPYDISKQLQYFINPDE